jgi:hypothetical protein
VVILAQCLHPAGISVWEFAFLGLAAAVAALGMGTQLVVCRLMTFGLAGAGRRHPLALLRIE